MGNLFMAFASAEIKNTTSGSFKRYHGLGKFNVVALNPSKTVMEELYGREIANEPVYNDKVEINGVSVDRAKLQFILKTNDEKHPDVNLSIPLTFNLRNAMRYNGNGDKTQICNHYGQFAWISKEDFTAGKLPDNVATWFLADGIRPAYQGEQNLIEFLRAFLNISTPVYRKDGVLTKIEDLEKAKCYIENPDKLFKGDFSELTPVVALGNMNAVYAMVGIRTTDEGKTYQDVFDGSFAKGFNYSEDRMAAVVAKINSDVMDAKNNGRYGTTDFYAGELKEYSVEASNTSLGSTEMDSTFGASPASPWG